MSNFSPRPGGQSRILAAGLLAAVLLTTGPLATPARADERSTARRFEQARRDEPSLIAFLRTMPKGGDLHNHASGAYYLEQGLDSAVEHGLFYNPKTFRFESEKSADSIPAAELLRNDPLRYQFFNIASMRGATEGPTGGHDHFFRTFGFLGSPWQAAGLDERLATVARRARMQNLQYLELMAAPADDLLGATAAKCSLKEGPERALKQLRPALDAYVAAARQDLDLLDREIARRLTLQPPISRAQSPLTIRYLISGLRTASDDQIFGTWAAAFALMKADRRVVGVNLVAPEDAPLARRGFDRHMQLLDFLWKKFDHPNVTLHAGELNLALSPMEDMTNHIRKSIEIGHAKRIGHGTAVAWEDDVEGLLRKMREQRVAVEVCPTSAAVILGVEGDRHPFQLYRRAGVPLTLNTDDEGVSRSNITMEYVLAVKAWGLSYRDLKELARNSIEYSFLPGESLFEENDYRRVRPKFQSLRRRGWQPSEADKSALAASDKATVQARLERALLEFEK